MASRIRQRRNNVRNRSKITRRRPNGLRPTHTSRLNPHHFPFTFLAFAFPSTTLHTIFTPFLSEHHITPCICYLASPFRINTRSRLLFFFLPSLRLSPSLPPLLNLYADRSLVLSTASPCTFVNRTSKLNAISPRISL
jgi:hypothetical protein